MKDIKLAGKVALWIFAAIGLYASWHTILSMARVVITVVIVLGIIGVFVKK